MLHTPAHKAVATPVINFNQFKIECLHCDGRWHEAGVLWTRAGYPRFDTAAEAQAAADAAYGSEHAEFIRIRPVVVSKPAFRIETLRRVHTVRVYYTASPHADSPLAPHPEVQEFTDPVEAQRWATAQMKWEATVGVVCDQLSFRVEGDFVGVSINKELFAQVPQLKSHH